MSTATMSEESRLPHATEWNRNAAIRRAERVLALVKKAQEVLTALRPPASDCRGRYADGTPQYLQVLDADASLSRIRDLLLTPKRRRIRALETAGEQFRMIVTGHQPPKAIKEDFATDDVTEAVERFVAKHPDAVIDTVADAAIRSICTPCGAPIFVETGEEQHEYDVETNTYRCAECVQRQQQGEEL